MTQHPDLFAALAAPFESHELKTRSQQGRQLHYITARTAMNRLDSVLGPENWTDGYEPFRTAGVKCILTITLPDGRTVVKTGLGGVSDMHDESDDDKSGESDALKRAAVKFGVARYLYRDGVPTFARQPTATAPEPPRQPVRNGAAVAAGRANGKARHDWPGKGPGSAGVAVTATLPAELRGTAPGRDPQHRESVNASATPNQLAALGRYAERHGLDLDSWLVEECGLNSAHITRQVASRLIARLRDERTQA